MILLFTWIMQLQQDHTYSFAELTHIDALEIVAGYGEDTRNFRLALHWQVYQREFEHMSMEASWALNYATFDNPNIESRAGQLRDLGATPVVKLTPKRVFKSIEPFMEFGIGAHYLTERDVGAKYFSTNFQFGDHIGIGASIGKRVQYTFSYQFQHFSNGGIGAPNPGINFHMLSMGIKWK